MRHPTILPSRLAMLPQGSHAGVRSFADYHGPIVDSADVIVVGSGPGGAVVAKELAEAGLDVIVVESGPPFGPKDYRKEAGASMQRMFFESGQRIAFGKNFGMPTLQVNGYGGGSKVNSAICARMPDFCYDSWRAQTGIDLTAHHLEAHFERVERYLGVAPTPHDVLGKRNLRFKQGCDALGMTSEPTHRNVRGCKGSGECFTGCPTNAKQSTDLSYMPTAIRHGARVYTSVRAERITHRNGKVTGLRGHAVEPFTGKIGVEVTLSAKKVVLAAGCMQSPVILKKSGLNSKWVGEELQFHPGLAIMAVYNEKIDPWDGATQGYHSLHHLKEGIKLEVLWAPPEILATRLPGIGHVYQKNLLRYDHMAPFDVITAANRSRGRVRASMFGHQPKITYNLHQEDMDVLMRGLAILCDVAFASGAVGVLPGLHGAPDMLRSPEDVEIIRSQTFAPNQAVVGSNHAFGTTRMSRDPSMGVVDEWGKHHTMNGLYIADTGIFVGSPAVNPMLTVMALADRVAEGIVNGD